MAGKMSWSIDNDQRQPRASAGRGIRSLTDTESARFILRPSRKTGRAWFSRKLTLCQSAESSWNFQASTDVNVSDGLEYVFDVSGLTIE